MSSTPQRRFKPWMLPVGVFILGLAELAILIWVASATSIWWAVLAVVLGWIAGFALLFAAGQQSVARLLSVYRAARGRGSMKNHMTRPVFTVLSAVLFFFPGLITDVAAVILLLTPVQKKTLAAAGFTPKQQRPVLFSRSRGGVIDGEIVIDASNTGGSHSANASAQKTSPPMIEGDVSDSSER